MITPADHKSAVLRQQGVLHSRPNGVTDVLFHSHDFFDARDLVQVKYEMLRRVQVEGLPVTKAASLFGFSRPAFYQAQAIYQSRGLPGLIPRRSGPRRSHKLTDEVIDFVLHQRAHDPTLRASALSALVKEAFGLVVHPRSLERALQRHRGKK